MRIVPLAVSALLLASLAGCAHTPQETSVAPTPTATPTPTPTVTPEPLVKPLLSELEVSTTGVGPVELGRVYVPEDAATDVLVWDETWCDFPADYGPDHPGWKSTYPGASFLVFTGTSEKTPADPISEIVVYSPEITTSEGVGVGSTVEGVVSAYGSRLVELANGGYALRDDSSQLVFWWDQGGSGSIWQVSVGPISDTAYAAMSNGCD